LVAAKQIKACHIRQSDPWRSVPGAFIFGPCPNLIAQRTCRTHLVTVLKLLKAPNCSSCIHQQQCSWGSMYFQSLCFSVNLSCSRLVADAGIELTSWLSLLLLLFASGNVTETQDVIFCTLGLIKPKLLSRWLYSYRHPPTMGAANAVQGMAASHSHSWQSCYTLILWEWWSEVACTHTQVGNFILQDWESQGCTHTQSCHVCFEFGWNWHNSEIQSVFVELSLKSQLIYNTQKPIFRITMWHITNVVYAMFPNFFGFCE
jgi:hypothetical protein